MSLSTESAHPPAPAVAPLEGEAGFSPTMPAAAFVPTAEQRQALDRRVERVRLRQAYDRLAFGAGWSLAVAVGFVGLVVPFFDPRVVTAWFVLIVAVQVGRLLLAKAYQRAGPPETVEPRVWSMRFVVGAAAAGAAWAFGPVMLTAGPGQASTMILVLTVLCLSAVATSQLSSVWPALVGFLSTCMLPTALTLWWRGGGPVEGVAALGLVAAYALLLAVGRTTSRANESLVRAELDLGASLAQAQSFAADLEQMSVQHQLESRRLLNTLEGMRAGTAEWDPRTNEVRINERWAAMLGYAPDELTPMTADRWSSMVHPDDLAAVNERLASHLGGNAPNVQAELRLAHRDGHWVWALVSAQVVARGLGGEPLLVTGTYIDVTARKADEQRWRARAEMSADWFWETDDEFRVTLVDDGVRYGLPIDRNRLLGRTLAEVSELRPVDGGWASLVEQLGGLQPFTGFVCSIRDPQGGVHYVELDGRPRHDDRGGFLGYEGVGRDVTVRRRATDSLKESLALVDALFETMPIPVVLKGTDGHYIRMNKAYHALLEEPAETGVTHVSQVTDAQAAARHQAIDDELLRQPGRARYEIEQRMNSGRRIHALVHKATLLGADGSVRGLVATLIDISEQKRAEAALETAKNTAELANRAKSSFLATMSHELRTPLNAVIGAAQLLRTADEDARERGLLIESIERSGTALLGLIENIMDLSRIEAGALELAREDFNLIECVESAVATAAVAARAKGLTVACIVEPDVEEWRQGDLLRLRQVLLNLLGNAVKFTHAGDVVLAVRPGAGAGEVRFEVRDTGVGIAAEALPHIFEPFRQADQGMTRRFGGSGLGLAIVRELVAAMDGRIDVESHPGVGTRFDLQLPLAVSPDQRPPPQCAGVPVAFHEPHEPSARALRAHLTRLGCIGQRCVDVAELKAWHDRHAPNGWFMIAVDAPGVDRLLDAAADWLDPDRVIGMTARPVHRDDLARESMGLRRSIVKPVLRSMIVSRMVNTGLSAPTIGAEAPHGAVAAGGDGRGRLLLVEDDPTNRAIVGAMLGHDGYAVATAEDGRGALEQAARLDVDAILMDWQMPDMDGLEVTRRLRAGAVGPKGRTVPIIALTANAFAEDRAACLAAGMNDFLTKPVHVDKLLSVVAHWTAVSRRDRERRPDVPDVRGGVAPVAGAVGDEVMAEALMGQLPRLIDSIERATAQGDRASARGALRAVCASADAAGHVELARLAADLEREVDRAGGVDAAGVQALRRGSADHTAWTESRFDTATP
jgi:PAS domain S-box-containing protein